MAGRSPRRSALAMQGKVSEYGLISLVMQGEVGRRRVVGLKLSAYTGSEVHINRVESMRTTLDIDRQLLDRAKAALGVTTYTEAIERALGQAVAHAELDALLDALRGQDLVWSLDELRAYRQVARGDAS